MSNLRSSPNPPPTCCAGPRRLSGIARTGLGFTQSLYERERFEEVLKVAADIRAAAIDEAESDVLFDEWLSTVGEGVAGYVTPKVAVAAVVGNDRGEILLTQRADSGWWLYPVGWADVGYSPSEIAMKEVLEETGIECEVVSLIAVLDGLRLGFARVPMYSIVFHCRMTGGELQGHPLETSAVGFFARDAMPQPLAGAHRWLDLAFRAIDGETGRHLVRPAPRTRPGAARRKSLTSCNWSSEQRDDRDLAVRAFPRVADRFVVDEAGAVGRERERGGREVREPGRLDLVAVGGEGLEPVPEARERPDFVAEAERVRDRCPAVSWATTDSQMS